MATVQQKQPISNLSRAELAAWCQAQGQPAFRADQVRRWLFGHRAASFEVMHDLPAKLRAALDERFELFTTNIVTHAVSTDGTEKLLLQLADGNHVECVLMRE